MKKQRILTIVTLPIMWLLYFLFELFTGRVTDLITIIGNIALIILFALVGLFINYIANKHTRGFKSSTLIKLFFVLMVVDQGIKIVIKYFFFDTRFEIINNFLSFHPIINTDGSWLNARFSTGVNFNLLILINAVALFMFTEIYRYYLSKGNKSFFGDMSYIYLFSGALCSIIDKIFYGGSLDFIGIGDLFIADIKDIYINLGILFFILTLYIHDYLAEDENSTLKDDWNSIKKFFRFINDDIKLIAKKMKRG